MFHPGDNIRRLKVAGRRGLALLLGALAMAASHGFAEEPELGTVLFKYSAAGTYGPAISPDGIGYGGDDNGINAVDLANGQILWTQTTNGWALSDASIGEDGTVYIGMGTMRAFDGRTGTPKWVFGSGTAGFTEIPAIGLDGSVWAACRDGMLYVLDGGTGALNHQFYPAGPVAIGADGLSYVAGGNGKVYAVDASRGLAKWTYDTGKSIIAPLALGEDGTIYVGGFDGYFYAIAGDTGALRWRYNTGKTIRSSPVVGPDGTVYIISSNAKLYAIEGASGRLKWMFDRGTSTGTGTPAVAENGWIWTSCSDAYLCALNAADGRVMWKSDAFMPAVLTATTGANRAAAKASVGNRPSPIIGTNGVLYLGGGGVYIGAGPAYSSWPIYGQNLQATCRAPECVPIQICTQPADYEATLGRRAVFRVILSRNVGLSFRWQKDGHDLADNGRISGLDCPLLEISNVQAADEGFYSVIISNRFGQVSSQLGRLTARPPVPGTLRWRFKTAERIFYAPSLGKTNGLLYLETQSGYLHAVDAADGSRVWSSDLMDYSGSALVVSDNGWIYSGGISGAVQVFDSATGQTHWKIPVGSGAVSAPALGDNDQLVVESAAQSVSAFDGVAGGLTWSATNLSGFNSPPVIGGDGTVYAISTQGKLHALSPNSGAPLWECPVGYAYGVSPAIGADGTLLVVSKSGNVSAVAAGSGALRWQAPYGGNGPTTPAIGLDGTVYGGASGKLWALSGKTGALKWEFASDGLFGDPAVAQDNTVYAANTNGIVYAFNGTTGSNLWSYAAGDYMGAGVVIGPDGTVYAASRNGWVYALFGTAPLAASAWPMAGHDAQHTGRAHLVAPPQFTVVSQAGGKLHLEWRQAAQLQSAENLQGPWSDLSPSNPNLYEAQFTGRQQFFRLKP